MCSASSLASGESDGDLGKLKHRVDPHEMEKEGLIIPPEPGREGRTGYKRDFFLRAGPRPRPPRRHMMEDMERFYEIKKGTIPQHDNLLAISKPEECTFWSLFFLCAMRDAMRECNWGPLPFRSQTISR